tara:strand:- start:165 stop:1001 length:837 start_codon:yes stop_codon:yes gene_type:complete
MISIVTSMTNPEERGDPWKEALACFEDFSEEIIIKGKDWPYEFKWDYMGRLFEEGIKEASGDWVIVMSLDYFFHERDINNLKESFKKYENYPAIAFPQYQFFTPRNYSVKTRIAIALNKKKFSNSIGYTGGADLALATLDNETIDIRSIPNLNIPLFQYDFCFRTKKMIAEDRARFARAWFREFNNYQGRGGPTEEEAYKAWFENVSIKYPFHTHKLNIEKHPKYIKNRLKNLEPSHFGYDGFGLENSKNKSAVNYLKGIKEKQINNFIFSVKNLKFT